uniref:Uncharacterized protein n=1 Tax=Meloidogyne enterolobii TaxID=390850 RepID=A0A6V7XS68_MELEN|nr:unnamed protein product [Meloidogyne enterolobii]
MVSKDRKRLEEMREKSRKRRSETASVTSMDSVSEKRSHVEKDEQSSVNSDVFNVPLTPSHSQETISETSDGTTPPEILYLFYFKDIIPKNKGGRPCKKRRYGSGRKLEILEPVSQAAEDFENEVLHGISRELDLDDIESTSQTSISAITLRRSTRHSSTVSRFSDMSFSDKWPSHRPIANNCSRVHKGFGCGAKNSNHMPKYYNSLCKNDVLIDCRCPYCKAILLPSETIGPAAFVKCCAKGRVNLTERFASLQDLPLGLDLILHNPATSSTRDRLLKNVLRYNDQLSFGQIRMERSFDFPESHRIVKTNNMFSYMLFDIRQPGGQQQPELRANCTQYHQILLKLDLMSFQLKMN